MVAERAAGGPPADVSGEARRARILHPVALAFVAAWLVGVALLLPDPLDEATSLWPLVLVGFVGALLGNATAVGGGIVFIPVMMLVYRVDPVSSLKMALVVQAFGMTSGALAWARRGNLGVGGVAANLGLLTAALSGALIGALALAPSSLMIKGLFGPVSIVIGLSMLLLLHRDGDRTAAAPTHLPGLLAVALLGGLITAWVAIGVGELLAAALIVASRLEPQRAIGFGVVLLACCSVVLGALHAFVLGGVPWDLVAFLVPGVVIGARCGPAVAEALGPTRLKLGFAVIAIGDGLLFLWQAASV